MNSPESGPSSQDMGLPKEETGGEIKNEAVYETLKVPVPENLVEVGYKPGEASVIVEEKDGKFVVTAKVEFTNPDDYLDLIPSSITLDDQESAQEKADEMIADIENWQENKWG